MHKHTKKTLLSVLLGSTFLSILLPFTLLSNNVKSTLNENTSSISELTDVSKVEKIFTQVDADLLIASKGLNWDGNLVANDFNGYTSIGRYAFHGIVKIKSVILSSSVTTIQDGAFANSSLTSIILPEVINIGENAFANNIWLTTIYARWARTIGKNAFIGTISMVDGGIKLNYHIANVDAIKAIYWGSWINKFEDVLIAINKEAMIPLIIGASVGSLLLIGLTVGGILMYRKKNSRFN